MARSQQLTENANYRCLEANYPKLKRDRSHRRAFHLDSTRKCNSFILIRSC
jgi:hypothetical protein